MKRKSAAEEESLEIIEASNNLFADLGISDATGKKLKTLVMLKLADFLERASRDGKSQRELAKIMGTTQPKVSDIAQCKFTGVSFERALTLIANLGCDINVLVGRPQTSKRAVAEVDDRDTFICQIIESRPITHSFSATATASAGQPAVAERPAFTTHPAGGTYKCHMY